MLKNENYDKQLLIGLVITVLLLASFSFLMFGEETRMVEFTEQHEKESLQRGQELFLENCMSCHGANGEGLVGPALNDKTLLEEASDGVLLATIQIGRPNTTMPAWGQAYGGALTDKDIYDIVNFIRAFEEAAPAPQAEATQTSGGEAGLTDAELAAQAFQKGSCGACHVIPGVDGAVGAIGPDLSDSGKLAESRIQSEGYTGSAKTVDKYLNEALIDPNAFLSPDCPTGACPEGLMPSFSGTLSSQEIQAVVSYLASLPDEE